MATGSGSYYITAGLSRPKDSGQTPTGNGSHFSTAGLLKEVEAAAATIGILRRRRECA